LIAHNVIGPTVAFLYLYRIVHAEPGVFPPPHACRNRLVDLQPEYVAYRIVRRPAELAQKTPVESKVHPQPFGNGKYPLSMWYFGKNLISEPVGKQQGSLLVAPFDQ
jgi:hypothetical protein